MFRAGIPTIDKASVQEILSLRDVERGIQSLRDLPLPSTLEHVFESAKAIASIMQEGGEILIVGDYDADGVCASAIMVRFFEALGYKNMRLIIPHRFTDGYGVSAALLEKHIGLARAVISVDNGISAFCAGEFCKRHGITFIITDHHTPLQDLPQADYIIDPFLCDFVQPEICGAAVAWYFCAGLKKILCAEVDMRDFLEYLAIASIADIMPLVGINRVFVKTGLQRLQSVQSPFAQLLRTKLKAIRAEEIAFYLVPLLNAAGRMAHANLALQFLLSNTLAEAHERYEKLLALNHERKEIQNTIIQSAQNPQYESKHFVISYGELWHEGVLGIVASNLAESKSKSAFVLSLNNGELKGSARSFGGLHLMKSVEPLGEYLLGFGGHAGALGLSLSFENLEKFARELDTYAHYEEKGFGAVLGVIESEQIDMELLEICEHFEPYGAGNIKPIFICKGLEIQSCKALGKGGRHFALTLLDRQNGKVFEGVEFFAKSVREVGQRGDVSFELMRDNYHQGLKLKIVEFQAREE